MEGAGSRPGHALVSRACKGRLWYTTSEPTYYVANEARSSTQYTTSWQDTEDGVVGGQTPASPMLLHDRDCQTVGDAMQPGG